MGKFLFLALITLIPLSAKADCYYIKNDDMKNNCLAMEKQETSYCYYIRDDDMKNYCLAKIKDERSYCYYIKNSDKKEECLAIAR